MTHVRGLIVVCLLGVPACDWPETSEHGVVWLDQERFASQIEPLWEKACGNPSCHANDRRAFSLYVPLARRLDPARTYVPEALAAEEIEHNYTVSCVLASDREDPRQALLVRKPLAEYAHEYHGGGAIFLGEDDRSYRMVLDWMMAGGPSAKGVP